MVTDYPYPYAETGHEPVQCHPLLMFGVGWCVGTLCTLGFIVAALVWGWAA